MSLSKPARTAAKKFAALTVVPLTLVLLLAGCGAQPSEEGTTPENPILTSGETWDEVYFKVKQDVYMCVVEHEDRRYEEFDCDWARPNPGFMPKNVVPIVPGPDEDWKLEYLKVSSGQIITCLTHYGTSRDCSWVE